MAPGKLLENSWKIPEKLSAFFLNIDKRNHEKENQENQENQERKMEKYILIKIIKP